MSGRVLSGLAIWIESSDGHQEMIGAMGEVKEVKQMTQMLCKVNGPDPDATPALDIALDPGMQGKKLRASEIPDEAYVEAMRKSKGVIAEAGPLLGLTYITFKRAWVKRKLKRTGPTYAAVPQKPRKISKPGKPITEELIKQIVTLRVAGHLPATISEKTGIAPQRISQTIYDAKKKDPELAQKLAKKPGD